MPSERPRWAMLTRPVTKSGSSRASEANSSMTMSRRGIASRWRAVLAQVDVVLDVLGAGVGEQVLAAGQLGAEGDQRALDQVGVEVGDHADGVRQVVAVLERGAALVVDEHEGHAVGPVGHREGGDQRLQQLGLAGAGGAGDQPVRAVAAHVDGEGAVEGDPDDRLGGARLHGPARHDGLGPDRLELHHLGETAGRRQDRVVVATGDVTHGRQRPRHPLQPGLLDEVGRDVLHDGDALLAQHQPRDGLHARRRSPPRAAGARRSPGRSSRCPAAGPP